MKLTTLFLIGALTLLASCQNSCAKNYGGSATKTLPAGQKVINVTWKGSNLWILTRPMTATDSAVTYKFQEESNHGIFEGTYTITETR